MVKKLVGFKRFKGKDGRPLCLAMVVSTFTDAQRRNGARGCDVEKFFMPDDQYDYLVDGDLGKVVFLDYDVSGDRHYLSQVMVIRGDGGEGGGN